MIFLFEIVRLGNANIRKVIEKYLNILILGIIKTL
jgi:hypothetical protein